MVDISHSQQLRVAAARADFLENGRAGAAGIPDVVAASWVRSKSAGVDIDRPAPRYSSEIDTSSRLVRCARPVLDQLCADVSDTDMVIALTDHNARLVQRLDISSGVARLADRVEFAPGFGYEEETMGTNGVGTTLQSGQAVSIVGAAHYMEQLQPFACTAAPVVDPITGRLEGVLDISTVAQSWSPLMHTLVKSAAKDISRNIINDRTQAQQALFNTYLHVDARSSKNAVFGFGCSVVMANAAAQNLFDAEEQAAIRDHALFLMRHRDRMADTITLSSGRQVRMRGTRIVNSGDASGIVVVAEPVGARRLGIDDPTSYPMVAISDEVLPDISVVTAKTTSIVSDVRHRRSSPIIGGTSPSWVRACQELRGALIVAEPTIVFGEPGSGRFTLTTELFHAHYPDARSVCVDSAHLNTDIEVDLDALIRDRPRRPTLLIARNIDELDESGTTQLSELVEATSSSSGRLVIAATAADDDPTRLSAGLLNLFQASVSIPPLRYRSEDLQRIVAQLLRDLAPHRRVRLAPNTQRAIAAYSWPKNVTQLREAQTYALKKRPVGEVQAEDLPRYCHTTAKRPHLSPIQKAERDAIIKALQDLDGNRVAAARHVGISRSSLYRKIRSYGITA